MYTVLHHHHCVYVKQHICVYFFANMFIQEPRLICTVAEQVREADSKRSVEMAAAIGRIISSAIQVNGPILRNYGIL